MIAQLIIIAKSDTRTVEEDVDPGGNAAQPPSPLEADGGAPAGQLMEAGSNAG